MMYRSALLQFVFVLLSATFVHAQYISSVTLYLGGDLAGVPVELWKNGGQYASEQVDEYGYATFSFVELTQTTFRVVPHARYGNYTSDLSNYCPTDIPIDLSNPGAVCDSYITGTSCDIYSGLVLDTPSADETISFYLEEEAYFSQTTAAIGDRIPDVLVNVVAYDANGWFYFLNFNSNSNGEVKIPVCGMYEGLIDISTYHENYVDHYDTYNITSPASDTLSRIGLASNTNGTSITLNFVDANGSPWSVPSGQDWATAGCSNLFDPNSTSNTYLPSVSAILNPGDSSKSFDVLVPDDGEARVFECYVYSYIYDPNTYEIIEHDGVVNVTIKAGESKQANVLLADPVDVTVNLVDSNGAPVTEEVSVQAEPDNSAQAAQGGASGYELMGNGINSATMKLTPGVTYRFTIFPYSTGEYTSLQPKYYLFKTNDYLIQEIGSESGQSTSVTLTLETTSAAAEIQATGPNGPIQYSQVDARCYKSGSSSGSADSYGVFLNDFGQGILPLPLGAKCEIEPKQVYDYFSNQILISTTGRITLENFQSNTPISVAYALPDYTLNIRLLNENGSPIDTTNVDPRCTATSIDGKISTTEFDPNDYQNLLLPLLTEGKSPTHWDIFCEAVPYQISGTYYQLPSVIYATKAGADTDTVEYTLKPLANQAFEEKYSVKQSGGTLTFNTGEIKVPSSAFGDKSIVHAKLSTVNEEAKKAKPTGGLKPLNAAVDITWNEKEDGSGNSLQPKKSLLLKLCFNLNNYPDASPSQATLAHYDSKQKVWEIKGGTLTSTTAADGTEVHCLVGNAKNFSVWNAFLDVQKKKAQEGGGGSEDGSGDDVGESSSITNLRAVELTKTKKGKFTSYQLQCDSESSNAIFGFELIEEKASGKKKKKSKRKKKKCKKKKKTCTKGDKNSDEQAEEEEVDPFDVAEIETSSSCELNVQVRRGKKYMWRVREGNENPTASKSFKVKNKKKGKKQKDRDKRK